MTEADARPCPRERCPAGEGEALLESSFPSSGRRAALRLCGACGAALADPWPTEAEVEALYSQEYIYYQTTNEDPDGEAGSLKYRIAGHRYRRLLDPGAAALVSESIARAAELLTNKTLSYTLALPLALCPDAPMLDYGCGTGFWLRAMRRRGFRSLSAFDIAPNRDVAGRLEAAGIEMLTERQLAERTGAFDLVRLEHVFEHLQDPIGVLRRLRRLLKPSGWLVMTFPSIEPWLGMEGLDRSPARDHLQFPMHLVQHSRTSAAEWLKAGGFELAGLRVTRRERFITVAASPTRPAERTA